MAQRFGGKYSPTVQTNKFRGRKTYQSNIRTKILFLAPLPLLFAAIGELRAGDAMGMLAELGAFSILILAAWLLRDGLDAEQAYHARKIARPPAIPRKIFASVLTAFGVGIASYFGWQQSFVASTVFAIIAGMAHTFSFGIDPLRKKGMEGVNEFDAQRVAKAVEKAEKLVAETLAASKRIGDRQIEGRVEALASAARDMFRTVEEDPRDLTTARKFMSIYLKGARDATVKFADFFSKTKDENARQDYKDLLSDLEHSFDAQRETMLLDNRTDLDVEIEVLRDRLKQEGLQAKP
ncbi:hypothetical protein GCM10008927_17770 [Amylibacter ulvae]|uniref:5-bromo-4-chloroindolyl phosphate hydrolysis protein n=1 Tax=Paramylibacter ulvae TaxID=1651968 RepID=A0ABQ3D1X3_9RHOB|nr:5-bromo-4-chloroindolyl phosphate hydrolysis family protein [Amylibacter ulvae]GHA52637.1 hypothetical protein GCM10008927_17770 [Amylibacter ulvae]